MNLALEIVLVGLCFGVTYSSPATNLSSDAVQQLKPPTEISESSLDHNKVPTAPPSVVQNPTTQPPHISEPSTSVSITNTNSSTKDEHVKTETKVTSPPTPPTKNTNDTKNATADAKNTSSANSSTTVAPAQQKTTVANKTSEVPVPTSTTTQSSTAATTAKISTSTATPVTSVADHAVPTPAVQERQFDGPSFIGGIVLTVGLTVIGFIAFKFYKSGKIERNYRTL